MNTNLQTSPDGKKILFHLALTWRSITNHKPDRIMWEDNLCGLGTWERAKGPSTEQGQNKPLKHTYNMGGSGGADASVTKRQLHVV